MQNVVAAFLLALGAWSVEFNEATSRLTMTHAETNVQISGELGFVVDGKDWTVAAPRDAVSHRLALVDPQGEAQGYLVFNADGDRLEVLAYHRTRQFYLGEISFRGDVVFRDDSFPCRTRAQAGERVLPLATGVVDSATNDSLFAREEDLALRFDAANLRLTTKNAATQPTETPNFIDGAQYAVEASGRIHEASEAVFSVAVDKRYYQKRWVPYYKPIDRKRCPSPPTGWMSWNLYFDTAGAEENLAEARVGKEHLQPFGLEFWSIESWQGNSDKLPVSGFYNLNLEVNERQFPKGMKQLADDIRALGFRPGLWTAPFGTGSKEFYEAHKDWFLHDKDGYPMRTWNGVYTIDPSNDEMVAHMRRIHEIASKDWGYEFFKIDGMSGANSGYCAHFFERADVRAAFDNPQVEAPFERCVKALREGIGEDRVFLACQGHFTGPEAAFADAARTGADVVHPNQPVKWENVMRQAGRTLNQVFTNNIVFFSDPDTLLVNEALTLEEARVATTVVSLPGQMMFAGDKLAELPTERMRLLQKTLPVCDVRPNALYPFFGAELPVWNLKVGKDFGAWDVVALFNWSDEEATVGFDFAEIGLDEAPRVAFEFWTETYLGENAQRFETVVPARAVRLLALHRKTVVPQFLSSDRHVTQGAVDLCDCRFDAETTTLAATLRLIAKNKTTARFLVPAGFKFVEATAQGENASNVALETALQDVDGARILSVGTTAPESGDYSIRLKFEKR